MQPTGFMNRTTMAAIAGLGSAVLVLGASGAAAKVGVASAVNVDAKGKAPGEAIRVITLGQNVVFKEEITTDAVGLVQILLLDGTTFTVGPSSRLTIDEFVFDPNSGDAHVVATVTKGAFRFIGGQTSRKPGGATIKTPVGTIGIRGAMVEGNVKSPNSALFSMIYGQEVVFTSSGGQRSKLFKPGFSLDVEQIAGGNIATDVRPRTPADAGTFQTALAGSPDQHGGAGNKPADNTVAQSGVGAANSSLPATAPIPVLRQDAVKSTKIGDVETEVAQLDIKPRLEIVPQSQTQSRQRTGFISGLGTSSAEGPHNPYFLSSVGKPNFSVSIDGDSGSIAGKGQVFDINDASPVVASYLLTFRPAPGEGSTELITDGGQHVPGNTSDMFIASGRASPVQGFQHCTSCDFIDWGWWGTTLTVDANGSGIPNRRVDKIEGTWVAGDITNPADLPTNIIATYSGTALGTVARQTSAGVSTYLAQGDLNMSFNFNNRTGSLEINNFDNNSLSGTVADSSTATQALFIGGIAGSGAVGTVQGAFVNNGTNPAAGVIGNFQFGRTGYTAGGTIAGRRNP